MTPFKFFNTFTSPRIDWDFLALNHELRGTTRFEMAAHYENWNELLSTLEFYRHYSTSTKILSLKINDVLWVQGNPTFKVVGNFEVVFAIYLSQ